MIKTSITILIIVAFIGCQNKKINSTDRTTQKENNYLKSELHFDNCDSLLNFLKTVIITNQVDKNLKDSYFKIPFIKASFEHTKSLFPEECFIGMTSKSLIDYFGKWDYKFDSKTHPVWYILKSDNNPLAFDIQIENGIVHKFKVVPSSFESIRSLKN